MNVPGWYTLLLLTLAGYRCWRLLAEDTILERPRRWLVRLPASWKEGDPLPRNYREHVALFVNCPWCLGFWLTVAWWAVWQLWPNATEIAAVPLALSALVGLAASNLERS